MKNFKKFPTFFIFTRQDNTDKHSAGEYGIFFKTEEGIAKATYMLIEHNIPTNHEGLKEKPELTLDSLNRLKKVGNITIPKGRILKNCKTKAVSIKL